MTNVYRIFSSILSEIASKWNRNIIEAHPHARNDGKKRGLKFLSLFFYRVLLRNVSVVGAHISRFLSRFLTVSTFRPLAQSHLNIKTKIPRNDGRSLHLYAGVVIAIFVKASSELVVAPARPQRMDRMYR